MVDTRHYLSLSMHIGKNTIMPVNTSSWSTKSALQCDESYDVTWLNRRRYITLSHNEIALHRGQHQSSSPVTSMMDLAKYNTFVENSFKTTSLGLKTATAIAWFEA